jgi:hypothetical protein
MEIPLASRRALSAIHFQRSIDRKKYRWTFWRKIGLLSPAFSIPGPCLYLDVDTWTRGALAPFLDGWSRRPRSIKNWVEPKTAARAQHDHINSSAMLYEPTPSTAVWEYFHDNSVKILAAYPCDQGFVYDCMAAPRHGLFTLHLNEIQNL